ncbi:MAG TPA: sugar nucleotide-binding protein [Verrucomicrobiae bacterium]|jgi:dTDP-4-dehydrorhamnose reductase|nr:sugar nucleotide-binding protein [Verrucomicrobiae bacterium]
MILLLGASGYVGRTFASELRRRGHSFIPLTRRAFDYTRFDFLFDYLRTMRPTFVINAASYGASFTGPVTEKERDKMMAANAILPQMIARVCLMTKIPWGHLSGSIYSGAKVQEKDSWRIEPNLGKPEMLELFERHPEKFRGFTELDEPNFSFRSVPWSFFSGTKALAEEAIRDLGQSYIWRLRLPFNERDEPCNWLCRLQREALSDNINSLSHLEDCVKACLDIWELHVPFGIYNVVNPGAMTTRHMVEELKRVLKLETRTVARTSHPEAAPQSNCILDAGKLIKTGIKLRPVAEAFEDCLDRLRLASRGTKHFDLSSKTFLAATF